MADRSPPTAAAFSSFSVEKRIADKFARRRRISGRKNSHKLHSLFKNFFTSLGDFEAQMIVQQK